MRRRDVKDVKFLIKKLPKFTIGTRISIEEGGRSVMIMDGIGANHEEIGDRISAGKLVEKRRRKNFYTWKM